MAKEHLIGDFLKRIKRPIDLVPNQDYNLVTIKMNHKGVVLRGSKKGFDIKSKMYEVREGDFILSGIDARNGAFGIVSKELEGAIVTNDFWYFEIDETIISKRLFLELTATTWFDDICQKGSDGTTQRIRLQKDKFFNQKILLPEGDDQKELLNKILTFKKGQLELDSEIQSQKDLLTQLKQSILQEAIQGKLTEDWRKQNPNTEPASELLKRIKAEKEQRIKDKKIKKEKPLPPIIKEEIPFELPEGWLPFRIGDLINIVGGSQPPKGKFSSTKKDGYVRLVQIRDFKSDNYKVYVPGDLAKRPFGKTDVMIGRYGPPLFQILRGLEGTYNVALMKASAKLKALDNDFLFYLLQEPRIQNLVIAQSDRTAGQTGVRKPFLDNIVFGLPPIKEQNVIAEKIENTLTKCQTLKQEIKNSEANAQMLMQAVLKEAFESETKKELA